MKNKRIEEIRKQEKHILDTYGNRSEEWAEFYKSFEEGAWSIIRAYVRSNEKGFDEIVFTDDSLIWEQEIEGALNFCREAKIGWFVYASGYSRTMETVMKMVDAGATVGKFVVKEYTRDSWGKEEVVRVPGVRINVQ